MRRLVFGVALIVFVFSLPAHAQQPTVAREQPNPKTTPAYSLLVLRKVKVQAELEALVAEYSSDWPAAKKLQFELDALKEEMKKLADTDEAQIPKLTNGYGTLLLRRASLESEIQSLSEEEGSDWPTLKQKQRELELLDGELKKLMR
jgi:uncharacterized protein involved in exopolysaccharide biosynthesis